MRRIVVCALKCTCAWRLCIGHIWNYTEVALSFAEVDTWAALLNGFRLDNSRLRNRQCVHFASNIKSQFSATIHYTPIDHDFPPLLVYVCLFFMRKRARSRTRYFIRCVYVHKCFVCCVFVFSVSWSSTKPRLVTFKYDVTLLTRPRISNTPFTMHMWCDVTWWMCAPRLKFVRFLFSMHNIFFFFRISPLYLVIIHTHLLWDFPTLSITHHTKHTENYCIFDRLFFSRRRSSYLQSRFSLLMCLSYQTMKNSNDFFPVCLFFSFPFAKSNIIRFDRSMLINFNGEGAKREQNAKKKITTKYH